MLVKQNSPNIKMQYIYLGVEIRMGEVEYYFFYFSGRNSLVKDSFTFARVLLAPLSYEDGL